MGSKIYVKWAKSYNDDFFNFGDDLNPYIIEKLSNKKVVYVHFAASRINIIKHLLGLILKLKINTNIIKDFITSFFIKDYIIAIGSILQWYSSKRCIVWGSGIINRNDIVKHSKFLAVRGKYTVERIKELGMIPPSVLGDPALLLPLMYKSNSIKEFKLGIIPHIIHFEDLALLKSEQVSIINLNSPNIEKIIDEINKCDYIISTSLHGVIVSQAYGIKTLWFDYEKIKLKGDNVKFYDYFSSVGITEYNPFKLDITNFDCDAISKLIEESSEINTIKINLHSLQQKLLEVAPFPVKESFTLLQ